jgi:hypothetical protein
MREIRLSGSEGGGFEPNRFSLPLSKVGSPHRNITRKSFGRHKEASRRYFFTTCSSGSQLERWLRLG